MLTNGQPRISLRKVRQATGEAITSVNEQARRIEHVNSNTVYLKHQMDTLTERLQGVTDRVDAHLSMGFWARLAYLVRGR